MKRIVLAGGSGFIGRSLAASLTREGIEVVTLSRSPRRSPAYGRDVYWDGEHAGPWAAALDGADAVVNLTGKSVDCRYTEANRRELLGSRVNSVRALGQAIAGCSAPPRVWVQAGSTHIYGNPGDLVCDEDAPHLPRGDEFSVYICEQWEAELARQHLPGTRTCVLRMGFVLGREGGVLAKLAALARLGLGGTIGDGRQWVSWVHMEDVQRAFKRALESEGMTGPYNLTSPNPVTNANFMGVLRRAVHRPWSPPVPEPLVRAGAFVMGTEALIALTGRRAVPRRLLAEGFRFEFEDVEAAVRDVLG